MSLGDESLTPKRIVLLIAVAALGFGVAFATGLGVKRTGNTPAGDSSAPLLSSPKAPKVVGLALGGALPDLRGTETGHASSGTTTAPAAGTTTRPPATTGNTSTTTPPSTHTTPTTTTGGGGGGGGGG
jgi:hypothetical protein